MSQGYNKVDPMIKAIQTDDEVWLNRQQQRYIKEMKKLKDWQILDKILDGSIQKMKEEK